MSETYSGKHAQTCFPLHIQMSKNIKAKPEYSLKMKRSSPTTDMIPTHSCKKKKKGL
jgi:hypothetical protein